MNSQTIKHDYRVMRRYFTEALPAMGWHFTRHKPQDARVLPEKQWSCMFGHIREVANGTAICFSEHHTGCSGAACYFGFRQPAEDAGAFLASKEGFKQSAVQGQAFYRQINAEKPRDTYLILNQLDQIADDLAIEVVNYWVDPLNLSGLVTLSNFDSPSNDNAMIPFASGCQSMWTIPYKQRTQPHPKAVIGALDPAMRQHVEPHTILFSVPANRFHQMAENVSQSFAAGNDWLNLIAKHR